MAKISIKQLLDLVLDEAKKSQERFKDPTLGGKSVSDIETREDAFDGGDNLVNQVDYVKAYDHGVSETSHVRMSDIRKMIKEEIANIAKGDKAAPHGSGMVNAKLDAEQKKLLGHSCAKHVSFKNLKEQNEFGVMGKTNQIGHAVWHSLTERGEVDWYDVKFGDVLIENIPARSLAILTEKHHSHEVTEKHNSHEVREPKVKKFSKR